MRLLKTDLNPVEKYSESGHPRGELESLQNRDKNKWKCSKSKNIHLNISGSSQSFPTFPDKGEGHRTHTRSTLTLVASLTSLCSVYRMCLMHRTNSRGQRSYVLWKTRSTCAVLRPVSPWRAERPLHTGLANLVTSRRLAELWSRCCRQLKTPLAGSEESHLRGSTDVRKRSDSLTFTDMLSHTYAAEIIGLGLQ